MTQPRSATNKKSKLVRPRQLLGVDVYAVVTRNNPITNQMITQDINNLASAIWEQCGITFFLRRISRVTTIVADKEFDQSVTNRNTDPTPGLDSAGHVPAGSNPNNLMLASVPLNPTLNAGQCRAAARSPLITSLIQLINKRKVTAKSIRR